MFNATVTPSPATWCGQLGWIDTYGHLNPGVWVHLGLYLMKGFIAELPDTLFEAARIDGASEYDFLENRHANVKAAWLTLMIFSVQNLWNANNGTYIYSEQLKTMPYAISQITSSGIARMGAGAAAAVIMMTVPITVFVIAQSNVIQTMATSGIKE